MINRRSLIALSAALPVTRLSPRLDVEDIANKPLDIADVEIMRISPDASTLVGILGGNALCFVDAESLEVLVESSPMEELSSIDKTSINWSPTNNQVAFSLNALLYGIDSDIYLADVATAEISNLTGEGDDDEAGLFIKNPDVILDMYPVWTGDNELRFARHESLKSEKPSISIQSLDLSTTNMEVVVDLSDASVRFVCGPIALLSNGSMTFASQPEDPNILKIIMVEPDGTISTIGFDDQTMLKQIGVNDSHSLVFVPETAELLLVPHEGASEPIPFADAIGYDDRQLFLGDPAIGSNPDTYVGVAISTSTGKYRVFRSIGGVRHDHGYLEGGGGRAHLPPRW